MHSSAEFNTIKNRPVEGRQGGLGALTFGIKEARLGRMRAKKLVHPLVEEIYWWFCATFTMEKTRPYRLKVVTTCFTELTNTVHKRWQNQLEREAKSCSLQTNSLLTFR